MTTQNPLPSIGARALGAVQDMTEDAARWTMAETALTILEGHPDPMVQRALKMLREAVVDQALKDMHKIRRLALRVEDRYTLVLPAKPTESHRRGSGMTIGKGPYVNFRLEDSTSPSNAVEIVRDKDGIWKVLVWRLKRERDEEGLLTIGVNDEEIAPPILQGWQDEGKSEAIVRPGDVLRVGHSLIELVAPIEAEIPKEPEPEVVPEPEPAPKVTKPTITLMVVREGDLEDTFKKDTFSIEPSDVIKVGRLKSSALLLDDDSVARMHAVIEVHQREFRVIDLGSHGGTRLNGEEVTRNAPLKEGDVLTFGVVRVEIIAIAFPE